MNTTNNKQKNTSAISHTVGQFTNQQTQQQPFNIPTIQPSDIQHIEQTRANSETSNSIQSYNSYQQQNLSPLVSNDSNSTCSRFKKINNIQRQIVVSNNVTNDDDIYVQKSIKTNSNLESCSGPSSQHGTIANIKRNNLDIVYENQQQTQRINNHHNNEYNSIQRKSQQLKKIPQHQQQKTIKTISQVYSLKQQYSQQYRISAPSYRSTSLNHQHTIKQCLHAKQLIQIIGKLSKEKQQNIQLKKQNDRLNKLLEQMYQKVKLLEQRWKDERIMVNKQSRKQQQLYRRQMKPQHQHQNNQNNQNNQNSIETQTNIIINPTSLVTFTIHPQIGNNINNIKNNKNNKNYLKSPINNNKNNNKTQQQQNIYQSVMLIQSQSIINHSRDRYYNNNCNTLKNSQQQTKNSNNNNQSIRLNNSSDMINQDSFKKMIMKSQQCIKLNKNKSNHYQQKQIKDSLRTKQSYLQQQQQQSQITPIINNNKNSKLYRIGRRFQQQQQQNDKDNYQIKYYSQQNINIMESIVQQVGSQIIVINRNRNKNNKPIQQQSYMI